jgi:hypothetical protein
MEVKPEEVVVRGQAAALRTWFDWDEGGPMSPLPIETEATVDVRRRAVGLPVEGRNHLNCMAVTALIGQSLP